MVWVSLSVVNWMRSRWSIGWVWVVCRGVGFLFRVVVEWGGWFILVVLRGRRSVLLRVKLVVLVVNGMVLFVA